MCTSSTDNETAIFWLLKKRCARSKQLRLILRWLCWFKSSGSVVSRAATSMTQAVTISPANQWSAEFTRHVLVMVQFAWNLNRGGTEKSTRYQVLYQVENPPKVCRTEPYHAVPCSGKALKENFHRHDNQNQTDIFSRVSEVWAVKAQFYSGKGGREQPLICI